MFIIMCKVMFMRMFNLHVRLHGQFVIVIVIVELSISIFMLIFNVRV